MYGKDSVDTGESISMQKRQHLSLVSGASHQEWGGQASRTIWGDSDDTQRPPPYPHSAEGCAVYKAVSQHISSYDSHKEGCVRKGKQIGNWGSERVSDFPGAIEQTINMTSPI